MGRLKFKQHVTSQSFDVIRSFATTGTIIANRIVRLTSASEIKHTTGSSGRSAFGVALSTASPAAVQVFGFVDVEVSSRAVKVGDWLRATSGAVASTSRLGGTVRSSTALASTNPVRANTLGQAYSSAAAGTGRRTVTMFFNASPSNPFLA